MKKNIIIFTAIIILFQTMTSYADRVQKIPRRVFFKQSSFLEDQDFEYKEIINGISNLIYNSIAAIQPIVRVFKQTKSKILVELFPELPNIKIHIILYEKDKAIISREFLFNNRPDIMSSFTLFIKETANIFAPSLDPVAPEVITEELVKEEQLKDAAEETEFLNKFDKRFELTLWTSGLMSIFNNSSSEESVISLRKFSMLPLIFDFSWYIKRRFGLIFSFYFDYNDEFHFASETNEEDYTSASSDNLFLLPGIGITYRTIGRVSAQFNVVISIGGIKIDAHDDITGIVDAGESTWICSPLVSFNSILSWNITPSFALKTKVTMHMNPMLAFFSDASSYKGSAGTLYFQFFSLGASYRF